MDQRKNTNRKKSGSVLFYCIFALLLMVFIVSFWYVASYFLESREQELRYDELSSIVEAAKSTSPAPTASTLPPAPQLPEQTAPSEISQETEATEPEILPEYAQLYEMNSHMVGWIRIDNTRINYPVMQSPDEPDYYLSRNFDRKNSSRGCIYAEEACDLTAPSDNITLYGHHMQDGSMFTGLKNYVYQSFWEDHRYINFDTLTQHHTYEVFAVFKTTAALGQGFSYHLFTDAEDEADFDEFISNCLSLSFYDTDIVPEYGDKIICLSTCEYTQKNGRLVVAAVRIE